jgi:hypothetical protein
MTNATRIITSILLWLGDRISIWVDRLDLLNNQEQDVERGVHPISTSPTLINRQESIIL